MPTMNEILAGLKPVTDSQGVEWFEGLVPTEACAPGEFRPIKPDRVATLLPSIAVEGQLSPALGVIFDDLPFVIEQGRHRLKVMEMLRRRLLVRLVYRKHVSPALLNAMRATVEESNEKLDDVAALLAVRDTMANEGVSASVAAARHHIRPEVVSRCGYILALPVDDPYVQVVMGRNLTTEQIALLKGVKHEERLAFANRLARLGGDPLTTKELKTILAGRKNGNGKKSGPDKFDTIEGRHGNATVTIKYTGDKSAALADARKWLAEQGGKP